MKKGIETDGPGWTGQRILLVEDNLANQHVIKAMLAPLKCRIDVVGSGREAIEALSRASYHVALMNCQIARSGRVRMHKGSQGP